MPTPAHVHPADLHGIARLLADATAAVTDIVEAMHDEVASPAPLSVFAPSGPAGLIPRMVYSSVRGTAHLLSGGIDLALAPVVTMLGERTSTPQRDTLLSVLNGVVGDHLADARNPLAIPTQLRRSGRALLPERRALQKALPRTSARVAVFVHGLCGTDGQWKGGPVDYGAALERDFGYTPLYLRYNSGLHISTNGRRLAALLEALVSAWPHEVDELLLIGHSMGGLALRSAFECGRQRGHAWTARVQRMAFLGSPHHGAPLERRGLWFQETVGTMPYAAPLARLGRLRSAGVTDLRHGNLLDDDWKGRDRFAHHDDTRRIVPLPADVDCLAVAATTGGMRGDVRDRFVGDGLVPVESALGHHPDPERELGFHRSRRLVVHRTGHMALLRHPEVYGHLARWLDGDALRGQVASQGRN